MATSAAQPPRLLDRLRHACRVRHFSIRTEDAYAAAVPVPVFPAPGAAHEPAERFIRFHGIRHPGAMASQR